MALPKRGIESEVLLVESSSARTTVVCLCLFYIFLIALGQGLRCGRMAERRSWSNVLEALVLLQCMICVAFVATVAILEAGLSMTNKTQCHVSIRLCIALYASGKVALYLFFNERIHILRAPFMRRFRDPIWIVGNMVILGGFGGVQAYASVSPMASFDSETGFCSIGIAADAAICVIVFDSVIGGVLTGIFVKILWPAVRFNPSQSLDDSVEPKVNASRFSWLKTWRRSGIQRDSSKRRFKAMLWRNVLGCAVVLINTLVNNVIFLTWRHSHKSEVCLITCMTDIVWGMLITNWLTMGSAENKDRPPQKLVQLSDASTVVPVPAVRTPLTPWEKHWGSHVRDKSVDSTADGSHMLVTPLDFRSLGVIPEPIYESFDQLESRVSWTGS